MEGRGCRSKEPLEGNMASASKLGTVSTRQQRIAELAKQSPLMGFTSLAYFIDVEWLREAYLRTRKDGATGVEAARREKPDTEVTASSGTRLMNEGRMTSGTALARRAGRAYE